MIYLNFTDLNEEAKDHLMELARERLDIEELKEQAILQGVSNFDQFVDEKAEIELSNADYIFNI